VRRKKPQLWCSSPSIWAKWSMKSFAVRSFYPSCPEDRFGCPSFSVKFINNYRIYSRILNENNIIVMIYFCYNIIFSELTLNSSSTIIHVIPSVPSPTLISLMWMANWSQKPMNELAFMLIPSKSFSWDVAITIAAADVKPADTGPDMKSIKNPIKPKKLILVIQFYVHRSHIGKAFWSSKKPRSTGV